MTNFNVIPTAVKISIHKWTFVPKMLCPWVADMDFPRRTDLDALHKVLDHGVLGYELPTGFTGDRCRACSVYITGR